MGSNNTFNQRCYDLLCQIPKGKVVTYADIAHQLGNKAYQAVGNAMAKNPDLISVPCHRVVKTNGEIGQYALGKEKKLALLSEEGVEIKSDKVVNLPLQQYKFN